MKITRKVGDMTFETELTDEELTDAYLTWQHRLDEGTCRNYLDGIWEDGRSEETLGVTYDEAVSLIPEIAGYMRAMAGIYDGDDREGSILDAITETCQEYAARKGSAA